MTLILIEAVTDTTEAFSLELHLKLNVNNFQQIALNIFLVNSRLGEDRARNELSEYPKRHAIGAADIWKNFPEYRHIFAAVIERHSLNGTKTIIVYLNDTMYGDHLHDHNILLFEKPFISKYLSLNDSSFSEKLNISEIDFTQYSYLLLSNTQKEKISILNHGVYFCKFITFKGTEIIEILPDIKFANMQQIIYGTDLIEKIEEFSDLKFPGKGIIQSNLPTEVSGAFITPQLSQYYDANINRILAAASLCYNTNGINITKLFFSNKMKIIQPLESNDTYRPYLDHTIDERNIADTSQQLFVSIIEILKTTTESKFINAKEDYRLLALDTVEDSRRSGVQPLQFVQLWMAIERLLPFRHETTIQLALALSAFFPAKERCKLFKKLKDDYKLRSQIAHGYNFRRDAAIKDSMTMIASLFREIFKASLSFEQPETLRDTLVTHVLEGKANSFNESNP